MKLFTGNSNPALMRAGRDRTSAIAFRARSQRKRAQVFVGGAILGHADGHAYKLASVVARTALRRRRERYAYESEAFAEICSIAGLQCIPEVDRALVAARKGGIVVDGGEDPHWNARGHDASTSSGVARSRGEVLTKRQ